MSSKSDCFPINSNHLCFISKAVERMTERLRDRLEATCYANAAGTLETKLKYWRSDFRRHISSSNELLSKGSLA